MGSTTGVVQVTVDNGFHASRAAGSTGGGEAATDTEADPRNGWTTASMYVKLLNSRGNATFCIGTGSIADGTPTNNWALGIQVSSSSDNDNRFGRSHSWSTNIHEETVVRVKLLAELHTLLEQLDERAHTLAVYANDISPSAAEALELARLRYEQGKFSYIELLDAQRTAIDVDDGRAQALIAYDLALVRLESLLGRRLGDNDTLLEDSP